MSSRPIVNPSSRSGRGNRGLCVGLRSEVGSRSTVIGSPPSLQINLRLFHILISLVTGTLPRTPDDQPPMMPENIPAPPPARTIKRPPGRNLLTVVPASDGGPPSAIPLAPA